VPGGVTHNKRKPLPNNGSKHRQNKQKRLEAPFEKKDPFYEGAFSWMLDNEDQIMNGIQFEEQDFD